MTKLFGPNRQFICRYLESSKKNLLLLENCIAFPFVKGQLHHRNVQYLNWTMNELITKVQLLKFLLIDLNNFTIFAFRNNWNIWTMLLVQDILSQGGLGFKWCVWSCQSYWKVWHWKIQVQCSQGKNSLDENLLKVILIVERCFRLMIHFSAVCHYIVIPFNL